MRTASEIEALLAQCTGSESYHFNAITKMMGIVYTDGIHLMAHECEAHWLIDAIASHQRTAMKDEMLSSIQFWTLTIHEDHSATLICERDAGDIAIKQEIAFTDFPLESIRIWLERGMASIDGQEKPMMIAMLPQER